MSPVESIRFEMSGHVRHLAFPAEPGESVKSCVRRVASKTGLSFGQIRRLWYSEWTIIPAHVADKIRDAVARHDCEINRRIESLRDRHARLYALTHHSSDPEFYQVRAADGSRGPDDVG